MKNIFAICDSSSGRGMRVAGRGMYGVEKLGVRFGYGGPGRAKLGSFGSEQRGDRVFGSLAMDLGLIKLGSFGKKGALARWLAGRATSRGTVLR